jgi:hypothetical protein
MASQALQALLGALGEIADLQRANPTPVGALPAQPAVTRVIGRASVVLLSSHFERYIYSINEEAADTVNRLQLRGHELPEKVRVRHSKIAIDALALTGWDRRREQLEAFVNTEGWLWAGNESGRLNHDHLIVWMKAPTPRELVRYYDLWGVGNIFDEITRTPHTRRELWLRIDELVTKRNNIAHGDPTTEATQADVGSYRRHVSKFCGSADKRLSRQLARTLSIPRPW